MRTIKVRFIKEDKCYKLQVKSIFRWKTMKYTLMGYCYYPYCRKTKKELIEILLEYYQTCIKYVRIIEYPMLNIIKHT